MDGIPALYRVVGVAPWHPAPEMRALRVPVDSSSRDQVKPMPIPVPVVVREGRDREPEAVQWNNKWCKVSRIDEQWGFDLWWMSRPMTRSYYRVRAEDGVEVTLFRDERGRLLVPARRLAPTHRHDLLLHRASPSRASTPSGWARPIPTSC